MLSHATAKILVVDDDSAFLFMLAKLLELRFDCEVFLADSPEYAFQQLKTVKVDLVVSDYFMPPQTGLDVMNGIEAMKLSIPIVMVSSSLDAGAILKARGYDIRVIDKCDCEKIMGEIEHKIPLNKVPRKMRESLLASKGKI